MTDMKITEFVRGYKAGVRYREIQCQPCVGCKHYEHEARGEGSQVCKHPDLLGNFMGVSECYTCDKFEERL